MGFWETVLAVFLGTLPALWVIRRATGILEMRLIALLDEKLSDDSEEKTDWNEWHDEVMQDVP